MDSVQIAILTASKGPVIEVATMDAVDVEVELAEVGAATVMTATLVASPSIHHLIIPTRFFCTDYFSLQ